MAECVAVGRRGESGGTREREPIELGETLTGGREEMSGVELIGEAAVVEAGVLLVDNLPISSFGTGGGASSSERVLASADLADEGETELDLRLRPKKDSLCFGLDAPSVSEGGRVGTGGAAGTSDCLGSVRLVPRIRSEMSDVFERRRPAEDRWAVMAGLLVYSRMLRERRDEGRSRAGRRKARLARAG